MSKTQDHLNIADITDDIIMLKNGDGALVLKTNAVNFGLLSEIEQMSTIAAFAQLLNSLSFSIQILIHSKRLDISSYLHLLDNAQKLQTNPLLFQMMGKYRQFIQSTIKENDVLDKQFYIVINVSSLEIGLGYTQKADRVKKIKTMLGPRKDQLIRQLNRVGLKAEQLNSQKLIELFYSIYNQAGDTTARITAQPPVVEPVRLGNPQAPQPTYPPLQPRSTPNPSDIAPQPTRPGRNHPFVVEELT